MLYHAVAVSYTERRVSASFGVSVSLVLGATSRSAKYLA